MPFHSHPSGRMLLFVLGALTVFAPLSIDMYLSAMPQMADSLRADAGAVQWTLSAFFIGFASGQLFYGPFADRYGRKPPLMVGMALYVLTSFACALVTSVEPLIALRLFQAIGACAGGVIARAMVRDLFPPEDCGKVFASMMLITSLAPMLAPLLGGVLARAFGWRSVFLALSLFGAAAILLSHRLLPETLPPEKRRGGTLSFGSVLIDYWHILRHPVFLGNSLAGGLSMAGVFVYISASPFLYITVYGLPESRFVWYFGGNALGMMLTAMAMGRWGGRLSGRQQMVLAIGWQVLVSVTLALFAAFGEVSFWGMELGFLLYACMGGVIMPNCSVESLLPFPQRAGMASALMGTLTFALAALSSAVTGAVMGESSGGGEAVHASLMGASAVMAVCALGSGSFILWVSSRSKKAAA